MNFTDPENRADDYKTVQVPVNIYSVLSSSDIQEVVKNDKMEYIQPTSSNQTEEPGKVNYTIIHTFQLIHILMMTCLYHMTWKTESMSRNLSGYSKTEIKSPINHMSQVQAERSIVEIANTVFGRNKFEPWKIFKPKQLYYVNTLPASSNTNT